MEIHDLYTQLACGCTGNDSNAEAAWLQVALRQDRPAEAARAEAYWAAADEREQEIIAAKLGWLGDDVSGLCQDAIARDFQTLEERANYLLDFQG